MRGGLVLWLAACTEAPPSPDDGEVPVIYVGQVDDGFREDFTEHGAESVDILWVVDPALPPPDIDALLAAFPDIAATLAATDVAWRVGVVSLAPASGAELGALVPVGGAPWLEAGDGNASAFLTTAFASVLASEAGSPRAFDAVLAASGLYRAESAIEVVTLSSAAIDASAVSLDDLEAWSVAARSDSRLFAMHAVTGCGVQGGVHAAAAARSGGSTAELCADVYWSGFVAGVLRGEWDYPLSDRPDVSSLYVTLLENGRTTEFTALDPVTLLGDYVWSASRNSVDFLEYVPDEGVTVSVEYEAAVAVEAR